MHEQLLAALLELESVLQQLALWESEPPSDEAMLSVEPFAVDTMDFNTWLQWVFIPRLRALANARAPLPQGSGVASMAEYWCQQKLISDQSMINVLKGIDDCLSSS